MSLPLDELRKAVQSITANLGLDPGYISELKRIDDWLFVVQAHALLESAVTWALVEVTLPLPIADFLRTLDFSGGRSSKVALAQALDLLEDSDVKFVRMLSRVRNRLVHNIRHVRFKFADYVAELNASEKQQFEAELLAVAYDEPLGQERERALCDVRDTLWTSTLLIVATLQMSVNNAKIQKRVESIRSGGDYLESTATVS